MIDLNRHARKLHRQSIIIDIHDHMFSRKDFDDMNSGGVTVKFCHLSVDDRIFESPYWSEQDPLLRFLKSLDYIQGIIESSQGGIRIIRQASDVESAKAAGCLGVLLGNEGGSFLRSSPELLRVFYRLGLRMVQLTWGRDNDLAASQDAYESAHGLTKAGCEMVAEMCRLGMLIDMSHLSRRSIDDCFDISDKPLIFSHGRVSKTSSPAGLDPRQMKRLAQNRGIIGMHFCSHILNPKYAGVFAQASIEELLDQIDLAIELGGEACVALGPDYMPLTSYYLQKTNQAWLSHVSGLENIRQMGSLTEAMVRRNYSDARIKNILGQNALRVIREALGQEADGNGAGS